RSSRQQSPAPKPILKILLSSWRRPQAADAAAVVVPDVAVVHRLQQVRVRPPVAVAAGKAARARNPQAPQRFPQYQQQALPLRLLAAVQLLERAQLQAELP